MRILSALITPIAIFILMQFQKLEFYFFLLAPKSMILSLMGDKYLA